MLSFATQFPLRSGSPDEVLSCVATWLKGSPHRVFSLEQIEDLHAGKIKSIKTETQEVSIIDFKESGQEAIGAKHIAIDSGIIFTTTIVSRTILDIPWVGIHTERASHDPRISLKPAKKPQIVKTLIKYLGGGLDGELWISDEPYLLDETDQNMAARLINGDSDNYLPIVYISRKFHGDVCCDANALARQLSGLAHVVVEPSREFSRAIQTDTNSRNAYGGAMGIYLPTGQRSLILDEHENDWQLRQHAVDVIRDALLTRIPPKGLSWQELEAERSRINIDSLKKSGSTDLEAFVREFDAENTALNEQNSALSSEIIKLQNQIQILNAKTSSNPKLANTINSVQEFFPGESEQFLKEALELALQNILSGSRREMVINEILEELTGTEEIKIRKEKLKSALSDSRGLDSKTFQILTELGFKVEDDRRHHKITYFGDDRLSFTMSKTASDWRAGKNLASDIVKKIY